MLYLNEFWNKYKPGTGGVGASTISNRRAKNRHATVCTNQKCFPCYTTLGQYSNYTHNPNGYVPCPAPTPTTTNPPIVITYTITYFGNGNTSGNPPVDGLSPYNSGSTVIILGNTGTLVNSGYAFDDWNTQSDGSGITYVAGNTFIINVNIILYAVWLPL